MELLFIRYMLDTLTYILKGTLRILCFHRFINVTLNASTNDLISSLFFILRETQLLVPGGSCHPKQPHAPETTHPCPLLPTRPGVSKVFARRAICGAMNV